jgi:hypothetical protein
MQFPETIKEEMIFQVLLVVVQSIVKRRSTSSRAAQPRHLRREIRNWPQFAPVRTVLAKLIQVKIANANRLHNDRTLNFC